MDRLRLDLLLHLIVAERALAAPCGEKVPESCT
jgi:hypothetical protein